MPQDVGVRETPDLTPSDAPPTDQVDIHPNRSLTAAVARPRGQPRPGCAAAAGLPQDHRRVRGQRGDVAFLAAVGSLRLGPRPVELRGAHAASSRDERCSASAGSSSAAASRPRRWPRRSPRSPSPTSCRGSAARPSTRSATACSPSSSRTERRGFAISAHIAGGNVGTVIVALDRRPADRGRRLALDVARRSACRPSLIALAILLFVRETGHGPRRGPGRGQRALRRSGGSCATATCAGCT